MNIKTIQKDKFNLFIDKLIDSKKYQVIGVKGKDTKFVFDTLNNSNELVLDYDVTVFPPKKYFFPPIEEILKFKPKDVTSYSPLQDTTPRVIIGIHPYDLAGIGLMDKFFYDKELDTNYKARRENAILIGLTPTKAYKNRFFKSMVKDDSLIKYDLFLTDIGDKLVVQIGSKKGEELLNNFAEVVAANDEEINKANELKNLNLDGQKLNFDVKELPELLKRSEQNKIWKEKAEKCVSCGSCVFVCPTCHCFDVKDEVALSLTEGKRIRTWDGCMLKEFALVAGGHNFRDKKEDRYMHRLYKKGLYLYERYGDIACVGCGRCVSACVPNIANPVEVYNNL